MKIGDTVYVAGATSYSGNYKSCLGKVEAIYTGQNVAVRLEGHSNNNSTYGLFYFKPYELVVIEDYRKEAIMEGRTAVVQFLNGANQCSYACFDDDILIKDYVVVKTAHHGIAVAQVVGFRDMKCDYDREIIAKFDMTKFMERVEKRRIAAELKEKMEYRAKELQGLELYTTLAAYDKEMAKLLDEYKGVMSC